MHVYIYDDYLDNSRYNKTINRIEIRLTDLGLNGKIIRLGGIRNIKGTIQNEMKLGAKTFIAVGNNQTVNKIIGALISTQIYSDFQEKTLLGIIPVGDDNSIATSFGIKNEENACNILLARRIEKLDLGLVGGHYFLNQTSISSLGTILKIDKYSIEILDKGTVRIVNLASEQTDAIRSNPHDGLLDIFIKTKRKSQTHLSVKKIQISNASNKLIADDVLEIDTPTEISIMANKLRVIVGKDRTFK